MKKACEELKAQERNGNSCANMITMEMGKVYQEAKEEMEGAVDKCDFLDHVAKANSPVAIHNSDGCKAT